MYKRQDEFCMMSMNSFDERPLKNVAGGDLDLETEDEKEAAEAITKENEGLFNAMKEALDGAVTLSLIHICFPLNITSGTGVIA